ncbi:MAG: tripartite tricarboxylate transporter TctB family protein [Alphaproteobacteria bacterium]|nr:tripartite tricarboxylate transporter TctB family protein [Alphaproteobacteria bacterium]
MSDTPSPQLTGSGPRHRGVEAGLAIVIGLFGIVVMIGSLQVGIGWGVEGPRAGFFPFYVGLTILLCSAVNLYSAFADNDADTLFADWGQLRSVMSVVVPTTVYVIAIPYFGIYVMSALLIAVFMRWLGRFSWAMIVAIALGAPAITYITFERWFLVPLPKGPLEAFFGL